MKIDVQPKGKRYIMVRLGIGPIYAEQDGRPCLRWETSWKKIAGFRINTPKGCVWFYFRRYWR